MLKPILQTRMQKVEVSTEEQILFYSKRIAELKQQAEEEQEERMKDEVKLLQKVAALGYTIAEKEIPEAEDNDPQPWYYDLTDFILSVFRNTGKSIGVSSSTGMWTMVFTLLTLIVGFAWYPVLVKLNDSEVRIHNAATLHFFSHVWMAMGVLLLGFGFQFLAFNEHFRYLWTNIKTENSATEDFKNANAESKVRLLTAMFTYAFPVWIITQMFQFILG